jgi:hypothetical protein
MVTLGPLAPESPPGLVAVAADVSPLRTHEALPMTLPEAVSMTLPSITSAVMT